MRVNGKLLLLFLFGAFTLLLSFPGGLMAQKDRLDLGLRLLPDYGREIAPGETVTMFLEVRNNGDIPLTGIRLQFSGPEGWTVVFSPAEVGSLSAGSSRVVNVTITAPNFAARDNYTITILGESNETLAATTAFLSVGGGISYWLWIGIAVAAVVIAGFVIIFLRYGRG
ncbi:MAG: hypothetical protein HYX96_04260 [Chloroflexi bacterium]|nr:hypothetical protein [Chloroflexota bacterium]